MEGVLGQRRALAGAAKTDQYPEDEARKISTFSIPYGALITEVLDGNVGVAIFSVEWRWVKPESLDLVSGL